jgi:hypothetical protein
MSAQGFNDGLDGAGGARSGFVLWVVANQINQCRARTKKNSECARKAATSASTAPALAAFSLYSSSRALLAVTTCNSLHAYCCTFALLSCRRMAARVTCMAPACTARFLPSSVSMFNMIPNAQHASSITLALLP